MNKQDSATFCIHPAQTAMLKSLTPFDRGVVLSTAFAEHFGLTEDEGLVNGNSWVADLFLPPPEVVTEDKIYSLMKLGSGLADWMDAQTDSAEEQRVNIAKTETMKGTKQ